MFSSGKVAYGLRFQPSRRAVLDQRCHQPARVFWLCFSTWKTRVLSAFSSAEGASRGVFLICVDNSLFCAWKRCFLRHFYYCVFTFGDKIVSSLVSHHFEIEIEGISGNNEIDDDATSTRVVGEEDSSSHFQQNGNWMALTIECGR